MTMNTDTLHPTPFPWRKTLLAAALAAGFAASAPVGALPVGPQVVAGTASVHQNGAALTIQNSASAILDWQRFGIAAGESVRFLQPSASSSVLNRVLGNDPSQLLGQLSSNGRVWLVNPAGILVGPGARIDTAGFVGSTLNVRNEDFLAGRLTFQNTPGAGSLVNRGAITTTAGGSVYLIAPEVSNEGIITTPQGETILAAGQKVELIDTATPGVKVEITGEAGKATNLGQIATDAGRIGMVGALVKNSGKLDASSVVREGGRIFLKARQETFVEGEGQLTATGKTGGTIDVQGHHVAVTDQAKIDASGEEGGGVVRVGGDYRGGNPEIQNAAATWFGPQASIRADAKTEGQGGRVILWGNDATRAHGHISAQGAAGGKGGFVETSGHFLDTAGIDLKVGAGGEWLLDPYDITIIGNTDYNITGSPNFTATGNPATLNTATVNSLLNAGTSVSIDTTGGGGQPGNIDINTTTISKTAGGDATLTLKAHNNISFLQGNISSTAGKLNVVLMADQFGSGTTGVVSKDSTSSVSTNGGNLTASGKRIDWDNTVTTDTGAGNVWFKPSVSATPIGIVSSKTTGFQLTPTELGGITTTGVLRIGDTNAGNLSIGANPSASNAAVLSLESGGTVTQTAPITASKLAVVAWGDVSLNNTGNMVSDVAAQLGNASNLNRNFTFVNYSTLNVGSNINGLNGISIQTSGVYNSGTPDGVITLKQSMGLPITQSAGATLAGKAVYAEGGRVTLTEANPTGVIAGKATGTGSGDVFKYKSSAPILLSTVNVFAGILTTTSSDPYGVELEGSSVSQETGAVVQTASNTGLKLTTSGTVNLTDSSNSFQKFQTGSTAASINLTNNPALTLDGVSTNNGTLTVNNTGGNLTLTGTISTGTGDIQLTAPNIQLGNATAAATVSGKNVKLIATDTYGILSAAGSAGSTLTSTADLLLQANSTIFSGSPQPTLNAPRAGFVTYSDNYPITVGSSCNVAAVPYCLVVNPASMTLNIPNLVIGNSNVADTDTTSDIYVDAALSNPSNKVTLLSNGKVVQTAGITAGTLAVKSSGTTNLNVAGNAFANIAVDNSAGSINIKNSQNTTVTTMTGSGSVPNISGLNAAGGAVVLDVTGNITLNAPATSSLSGPGTAVTLAASGGFTKSGAGALNLTGTGSPRWLVYASSPTAVSKGGLTSGFREYSKAYPAAPTNTTDNGFVYASSGSAVQVNTILSSGSASHTYGSSPTAVFGYTLTGIDAEDVIGTPVYNPAVSSSTAAGSYTVQYASGLTTSQAAFTPFLPFTAGSGLSYTVSPAPVVVNTVSAALTGNVSKVYDGTTVATLTPANFVLSGFVGGDSATVTKTSGTYGSKNVGSNLPVYVSLAYGDFAPGGSTSLANYSLPGSVSGNIGSITPAPLTVAGATAQNKVYDATTAATLNLASATLSGLIGNDVVTLPASGQGSFADKNVGTAKPVTPGQISLTGADAGNYSVGTLANVAASITPAAISAVSGIRAMDKKYDGKTTAKLDTSPATFAGLLAQDVLTVAAASGQFADKDIGQNKPVAISGITLGGADAGNYTLTNDTATATANITPAPLTVTAVLTGTASKTYDGSTAAALSPANYALGGFAAGEGATVTQTAGSYASKNAGSGILVTAALTPDHFVPAGSTDLNNYGLPESASGYIGTILPVKLNASLEGVQALDKVYDGTRDAALKVAGSHLSGVIGNDVVSVLQGIGQFDDKNVGKNKPVTISNVALTGTDAGNYMLGELTGVTGLSASITPASIRAVSGITAQDKVYDATTQATLDISKAAFAGRMPEDVLTVVTAQGQFADKNAGKNKTVNIRGITLGGADAANYTLAEDAATAQATITPAVIARVSGITAQDKVYDATTRATLDTATANLAGRLAQDDLTVAAAQGQFADKNAGQNKPVAIQGIALGGADAANYTLAENTATAQASITPAKIAAVSGIQAKDKNFDATNTAHLDTTDATFNGLLPGDTLVVAGAQGQFENGNFGRDKGVSIQNITLGGADAGNYVLENDTAHSTASIAFGVAGGGANGAGGTPGAGGLLPTDTLFQDTHQLVNNVTSSMANAAAGTSAAVPPPIVAVLAGAAANRAMAPSVGGAAGEFGGTSSGASGASGADAGANSEANEGSANAGGAGTQRRSRPRNTAMCS